MSKNSRYLIIVLIIVLATCIVFVNYNSSIDKKLTDSVESN